MSLPSKMDTSESLRTPEYTEKWNVCKKDIEKILKHRNISKTEYRDAILNAFNFTLLGEEIFPLLYEDIEQFLRDYLEDIVKEANSLPGDKFFDYYVEQWQLFKTSSSVLRNVFTHMHNAWVQQTYNESNDRLYFIDQLALVMWKKVVFNTHHTLLSMRIWKQIFADRTGTEIDKDVVLGLIKSYVDLGLTEVGNAVLKPSVHVYVENLEDEMVGEFLMDHFPSEYDEIEKMKDEAEKLKQKKLNWDKNVVKNTEINMFKNLSLDQNSNCNTS